MKKPNVRSRMSRELLLVSLPTLALAGFAWHSMQPVGPDITLHLLGKWKIKPARESWMKRVDWEENYVVDVVFKPDGTYEQVTDGSVMPGARASYFWVWKGRYWVNGGMINMLPTATRFSRPHRANEGLDVLFVPCSDSIGCATDWEMFNSDKDAMNKAELLQPMQADWKKGIFVSEFVTEVGGTAPRTIRRNWVKQP